jgi:hypothetical protein
MVRNWESITAYALRKKCIVFPEGNFREARWEEHTHYGIAWFVWDRDGSFPKFLVPQDWEPLILFWKKEKLVMVTARPHFGWRDYGVKLTDSFRFSLPLTVVFEGSNHGARIRTPDDQDEVDENYQLLDYQFNGILTKNVPPYARSPRIPFTPIRMEDIHIRAKKTLVKLGIT